MCDWGKSITFADVMKLLWKYLMLKCAIICLLFIVVQRLDVSCYSDISEQGVHDSQTECLLGYDTPDAVSAQECDYSALGQTRLAHSLRTFLRANRIHKANVTRIAAAIASCGKVVNPYSINLYKLLLDRFPSGLNDTRNRFISLGKLVI